MGYEVNRNGSLVMHVSAGYVAGALRLLSGAVKTKLVESVVPSPQVR